MNRTFHTNVGWWYWIVIAATSVAMFYCFWNHNLLLTLLLAVILVFQIEMLIHTQYVVTSDNVLKIETGRFVRKTSVDIDYIISIRRVRSMTFFAPALSFFRLEITFKTQKGNIYPLQISPKNENDFIRLLQKRNPNIEVNQSNNI